MSDEATGGLADSVTIRPVETRDASAWLRMRGELWPGSSHEEEIRVHLGTGASDATAVLIAEIAGGEVCGFAEISIRREYVEGAAGGPVGYLEGWFVDPAFRGRGIGRLLVRAGETWAREQGCGEMASDAECDNGDGIDAHLACGFRQVRTIVHFIRPLRPPQEDR